MTKSRQPIEPVHTAISPEGWGLSPAGKGECKLLTELGLPKRDLEGRARHNTTEWLRRQFDDDIGAFRGYYDARTRTLSEPQTVNLIAPFQFMAAFDRYGDEGLLDMARRACDWLTTNMVETHPMSLVLGGVRDNIKPDQLWTKYTADYVTLNLGLWDRLDRQVYLDNAIQGSRFLLQAQNHNFAPKYHQWHEQWLSRGWQSFGRVIAAMTALHEFTDDGYWLEQARAWAEHALRLQADNGCFYLINDTYYSSDLAADEIRGLIRAYLVTDDRRYLDAGLRYADWHLRRQDADGSWPLSEDRWGIAVTNYKGPGDMPNIAIALLLCHRVTDDSRYLGGAVKALRYSMSQQQLPDRPDQPYADDPGTHWGFWSWDPHYDYTMSADQSTHHVRAYWFFVDYVVSLSAEARDRVRTDLLANGAVASP